MTMDGQVSRKAHHLDGDGRVESGTETEVADSDPPLYEGVAKALLLQGRVWEGWNNTLILLPPSQPSP